MERGWRESFSGDNWCLSLNSYDSYAKRTALSNPGGAFREEENVAKAVSAIEAIIDEKVDSGNTRYEVLLHKDLEIMRSDIDRKLETIRAEMRDQKVDLIKWFVGLFIALNLMIIGLYVRK